MTKSFSSFVLFLVLTCLALTARATELTDLGQGLSYLRIHAFDETAKGLTAAIHEREFLVLDLRHATTSADSTELFRSAVKSRESQRPIFILVGPATPPTLAKVLTDAPKTFVILGIKESVPTPQVVIDQSDDNDRRTYEALESGTPLATLISGKITKERYDEAALVKEFNSGNFNAASSGPPDSTVPEKSAAKPGDAPVPKPVEPLIDRVLQRAVHLHRALLALKQR